MNRGISRRIAVVGGGTGLLVYLLLTSVAGKPGGALSLAWGQAADGPVSVSGAQDVISAWPQPAQTVASVMLEKYGQPNTVSAGALVWFGHGAWKRTTVYKDGWLDQASVLHPEVLEQVITYRVPPDKIASLASFDSRLGVDSTRHELSFRSDSEKMNTLAINLADEIATGWKTVEQARAYAVKATQLSDAGKDSSYTKGFMFEVQNEDDTIAN
jgi:hypothetical protein